MIRIRLLGGVGVAVGVLASILVGVRTGSAACNTNANDAGNCKIVQVCCPDVGCSQLCFTVIGETNWYKLFNFQGHSACITTTNMTKKCKLESTLPYSEWCAKAKRFTSLTNCNNNINPTQGYWTSPGPCTETTDCVP